MKEKRRIFTLLRLIICERLVCWILKIAPLHDKTGSLLVQKLIEYSDESLIIMYENDPDAIKRFEKIRRDKCQLKK